MSFLFFLPAFIGSCNLSVGNAETYIRANQVGYNTSDQKTAVIMTTKPIYWRKFKIEDTNGRTVYGSKLSKDMGKSLAFPHHYIADFSSITSDGTYHVRVSDNISKPFRIGNRVYKSIPDSLLRFFRVQRCGNTQPLYHRPCHLKDPSQILGDSSRRAGSGIDLTGGWHDAADYVKYVNTTAHTAYLMLLTYNMNPHLFPDLDGNGLSDILDEAKIGLDWMMKMHYAPDKLLIQVQDLRDHSVGWRLPEKDPLVDKRPAYDLPSRSLCGSFSATMALASQVFSNEGSIIYSSRCLRYAREVYELSKSDIPAVSSGPDSMYYDKDDWDNLALAGVELYIATDEQRYLNDAIKLADKSDPVHWFSWGNLGGLAYARLTPFHPASKEKLESSLDWFNFNAAINPFGYPLKNYPWGSASVQMGVAILAILHYTNTGSSLYLNLAVNQRDFVLGKNSHGVSFIAGFGHNYPQFFHNQVSYLARKPLPGGFAEGFISRVEFDRYNIVLERPDRFARFQSDEAVYHDDKNDYLCNEPTISGNAQALFVFAWFNGK
ncbi:MAG: glycoside hydrolase family 9 protein [Candidatus Hatepunaea meridiana]|nr:glycoside hydrolase family 9 protein [Candidatus Hatepunaea meridiana]